MLGFRADCYHTFSKRGVISADASCTLDFATVQAAPDKLLTGKLQLAGIRTHKEIAVLTAFFNYLHKPHSMSERVEIDRSGGANSKFFFKIALPLPDLTDKAFSRWHIAVGLEIPSSHNVPFSCLDKLLYFCEKLGSVLLHVFVYRYLVVTEDIVKFVTKLCC